MTRYSSPQNLKNDVSAVISMSNQGLINDDDMTRLIEIYARECRGGTLTDREIELIEKFESMRH